MTQVFFPRPLFPSYMSFLCLPNRKNIILSTSLLYKGRVKFQYNAKQVSKNRLTNGLIIQHLMKTSLFAPNSDVENTSVDSVCHSSIAKYRTMYSH